MFYFIMSSRARKIGIIILAAGASTRMGQPKQLLEFQGETLIQRIIKTALQTECRPIMVVLGAFFNEIKLDIELLVDLKTDIIIVENSAWQQGMSTSVKIGLETLLAANPNIEAALFLLTDQPLLTANHLSQITTHTSKTIIASFYNNRPSVPALFDKKWFPELMQLTGDQGARKLLALHKAEAHAIPFPEGAFDVDTPENYEFLITNFE